MTVQCEIPKYVPGKGEIEAILKEYKTIAIVGLSPKDDRPSYGVAKYLQSQGYKIYPVNPVSKQILGEKSYPDLKSIPFKIDIVDVFRKPEFLLQIAKDSIQIGAKVLWMQEGVINNEAADIALGAGLKVVMNRCMLKDHKSMLG